MKCAEPLPHCLIAPLTALFISSSCARPAPVPLAETVRVELETAGAAPVITVSGLPTADLAALRSAALTAEAWQALCRVTVTGNDVAPVAGTYLVTNGRLEFQPRFPLDPGRAYSVRFDPARLPKARREPALETTVTMAAPSRAPTTTVVAVYPSAGVWPENTLRFYVQFSAPMSRTPALEHVRLLDDAGGPVVDPFLPVETDFWNDDYTRYTVFFDPGRVKRGIRPNTEVGRALYAGRAYTLDVDATWRDAEGQPLKEAYRHRFRAGPPDERPLEVKDWRVTTPAAGTRNQLVVTFPGPLDRGLLGRAIGVTSGGESVLPGDVRIEAQETRWVLLPRDPWRRGPHQIVVLSILEDPAGNAIGRAFEVDGQTPRRAEPERVTVPFAVR